MAAQAYVERLLAVRGAVLVRMARLGHEARGRGVLLLEIEEGALEGAAVTATTPTLRFSYETELLRTAEGEDGGANTELDLLVFPEVAALLNTYDARTHFVLLLHVLVADGTTAQLPVLCSVTSVASIANAVGAAIAAVVRA